MIPALFFIVTFIVTFVFMEFSAWWLHKYIMHGPLWFLHEDHHNPNPESIFQKNDVFAVFFAVPSFFLILFGVELAMPVMAAIGFGIMAYGFAYFFIHEVVIHRRIKLFKIPNFAYIKMLRAAHAHHHRDKGKEGCRNFGMLIVPWAYLDRY